MHNKNKELKSVKLGEIMEKFPAKYSVTFKYSDGTKESVIVGENEVKDIKDKYYSFIKSTQHKLFQKPSSANISDQNKTNINFIIEESDLEFDESNYVLSPNWKYKHI
jgi:hypothetical protein